MAKGITVIRTWYTSLIKAIKQNHQQRKHKLIQHYILFLISQTSISNSILASMLNIYLALCVDDQNAVPTCTSLPLSKGWVGGGTCWNKNAKKVNNLIMKYKILQYLECILIKFKILNFEKLLKSLK